MMFLFLQLFLFLLIPVPGMVDFDFLEGAWSIFVFGTHNKMIRLSSRKCGVLQEREWEGTLKYFSEFFVRVL
jgi:hypothetical protein